MTAEANDLVWQQMTAEMRQQVIALLVQMMLRWLAASREGSDERGE